MSAVLPRLRTAPMLEYLPVGVFGSVMGLAGLSAAWRLASLHFGVSDAIADAIGLVAIVVFVATAAGYGLKFATAPHVVAKEFNDPVVGNLFGTPIISLLLIPIVVAPYHLLLARVLWSAGVIAMLVFAWGMVSRWLGKRHQIIHATPAWIVPVVGVLDIPLAMPALQLPGLHGLAVLSLGVGLFFAMAIVTILVSRLTFEAALPEAAQATLMILLAPFSVGLSTYAIVAGTIDLFAQGIYGLMLFLLAVLATRLRGLPRCCPFRLSWWAVGFPLAAAAIASLRIASTFPGSLNDALAALVLGFASFIIGWLLVRTLVGVFDGELRGLSG